MEGTPAEVNSMLTSDNPAHFRIRLLFNKVFSPARVKEMGETIDGIIDELIDEFIDNGECDFLQEFSVPLPLRVISMVLGFEPSQHDQINQWTDALLLRRGQMGSHEEQIYAARLVAECKRFLISVITQRRKNPGADLISLLIEARAENERPLDDQELMSNLLDLVLAGHETTRSGLTSFIARLLNNPTQLELLLSQPSHMKNAVEEALRIDAPATGFWRVAKVATELGDCAIPQGSLIMVRMDSANRDESVFPASDQFDITRTNAKQHLSFGFGTHSCIAAQLARIEMAKSMSRLFERLDNIEIIAERSDFGL